MADNDVLRLRASLEDKVSPGLRAISQEAARFGRSFNFATPRREVEGLRGQFRALGTEVKNTLVPAFSSLGLVGGSMTLAVLGMARAVKGYSEGMQDLGISSKELGLSVRNLRAFEQAAGKVRIAPEEALQGLQSFKKNAEDFQLRIGSLRDELRTLGAGDVVEAIKRAKDPLEQMRIAFHRMEELQKRNPAVARRYAEAMFGSAKFARLGWEDFRKEFERVGGMTEEEVKKAEKLNAAWLNIGASLDILKQKAVGHLLPGVTSTLNDVTKIIDALEKVDQWVESKIGKGDPIGNLVTRLHQGRQDVGADPMGEDYSRGMKSGPTGSELKKGPPVGKDWRLPGFRENEKVKDGVKEGVFEGLQKFSSLQGAAAGGGSGGIMNASLGGFGGGPGFGGGGGGRRGGGSSQHSFGNGEFPNLGNDAAAALGGRTGSNPSNPAVGGSAPKSMPAPGGDLGANLNPGGLRGSEYLKDQRSRFAKELEQNPGLKRRFAALVDLENPGAGTAVAESALNRGAMSGRSLESILQGGPKSFYGPARRGMVEPRMNELARNPKRLAERMAQIDAALNGSNQIKGHTDQGSAGDPNYHKGGLGVNINRERFNDWGGFKGVEYSRRWREAQQRQVEAGDRLARERAAMAPAAPPPAGSFEDRWAGISTRRMDAQIGGGSKVTATGTVNVNVAGPAGTKVDAKSDGLFQTTKIQRVRQMEPAGMNSGDGGGQ